MNNPYFRELEEKGWFLAEPMIGGALLGRLQHDIDEAYQTCRAVQVRNGLGEATDGTVHHLLGQGSSFLDLLDVLPFYEELEGFFGGPLVVNSFGGVLNLKDNPSYVARIHRDVRSYHRDLRLMANMLVMLDDFTLGNGATYLLSGSHLGPERPTDEEFHARSSRAVGPAGSILVFDSRLWHAAGVNHDGSIRRALTLTFTPPYFKPQLDYPRAVGYERGPSLSPRQRQLVGYNSRIPASLDEWYQPPARRMYQPGQG